MKKLLTVISAIFILFGGCSKEDIVKKKPTGVAHLTLDGNYYAFKNFEVIYFTDKAFAFNSKGEVFDQFSLWFFPGTGNIHTGTFYVAPGEKLNLALYTNRQPVHVVGTTLLGYDYLGTGKVTFTKYDYKKGIAEGTFEFSREEATVNFAAFKVTNGYFSVKQ
jgi:hypothetical protein